MCIRDRPITGRQAGLHETGGRSSNNELIGSLDDSISVRYVWHRCSQRDVQKLGRSSKCNGAIRVSLLDFVSPPAESLQAQHNMSRGLIHDRIRMHNACVDVPNHKACGFTINTYGTLGTGVKVIKGDLLQPFFHISLESPTPGVLSFILPR